MTVFDCSTDENETNNPGRSCRAINLREGPFDSKLRDRFPSFFRTCRNVSCNAKQMQFQSLEQGPSAVPRLLSGCVMIHERAAFLKMKAMKSGGEMYLNPLLN